MMPIADGMQVQVDQLAAQLEVVQKVARAAAIALFTANAVLLLYPRQMVGIEVVDAATAAFSSYVSPLLVTAIVLMVGVANRRLMLSQRGLLTILLCVAFYLASAVSNGMTIKNTAVALYFGLAAYGVQCAG